MRGGLKCAPCEGVGGIRDRRCSYVVFNPASNCIWITVTLSRLCPPTSATTSVLVPPVPIGPLREPGQLEVQSHRSASKSLNEVRENPIRSRTP